MNLSNIFNHPLVSRLSIIVSLLTVAALTGCSSLDLTPEETCNSRAYIRTPLDVFVKQRFPYGAPVRLGIIPFSTPENIASQGDQMPGAGNEIARYLQTDFLARGAVTITEILGRSDWPGQREEFFHGNFRSLAMARDAGYDLVLVGVIEIPRSLDAISASAKLIEVQSGITVWNGRSSAQTNRTSRQQNPPGSWWIIREPNKLHTNTLLEKLASCLTESAMGEDVVPE